nr:unnamed protein product [Callosobruchus analis]
MLPIKTALTNKETVNLLKIDTKNDQSASKEYIVLPAASHILRKPREIILQDVSSVILRELPNENNITPAPSSIYIVSDCTSRSSDRGLSLFSSELVYLRWMMKI